MTAVFSECGRYRYRLTRRWSDGPQACFVMLNPSTTKDDPTITRCIQFAKHHECGGLVVVNLFAFRATNPSDMRAAADPVGPENDAYITEALDTADGPLIAAWGCNGTFMDRGAAITDKFGHIMHCIGKTKLGQPKHPLYLRTKTPLEPLL